MQFKITDSEKILLVEDNLVNCEIAVDMLETMGLEVDVANNGQQALDLYDNKLYRLILMDCEMPVMDGFSATKNIRERENKLQQVLVPIIALTAHAIPGSKEKCITSGMNDFLTKPFGLPELKSILTKWIEVEARDDSIQQVHHANSITHAGDINAIKSDWTVISYEVFNRFYLKQKKDGSNLVSNIVTIYLDQSPALLGDLTVAVKEHDIESVRIISHTLKSSSENVGASTLAETCRTVEKMCMNGKIDTKLVQQIYQDYSAVEKALKDILDNVSQSLFC